tara:strand:- start:4209 stop:5924 length:1716 start_codon:yes stop_codon:yes gene_type:complete
MLYSEEMDYNIDNYNINELLLIYGFDTTPSTKELNDKNSEIIKKFENEAKYDMVTFFNEAKKKVLEYLQTIPENEFFKGVNKRIKPKEEINLNINDYSIDELLLIYQITELPIKKEDVIQRTEVFIEKFKKSEDENMVNFFNDTQDKLLRYIDDLTIEKSDEAIIWEDKYNSNQLNQPAKIVTKDNEPIIGSNISTKIQLFIVLNSEFIVENNSDSTDYLVTLPDTIYDVISLRLYSVTVPKTWYTIDSSYGNNFFYLYTNESDVPYIIRISEGNYTQQEIVDTVNTKLRSIKDMYSCSINNNTRKTSLTFDTSVKKVTFYERFNFGNAKINYNLGWILGYRESEYENSSYNRNDYVEEGVNELGDESDNFILTEEPQMEPEPEPEPEPIPEPEPGEVEWIIESESPCLVKGTQYLQIYLDDFQKNRQNTNVMNAYQSSDVTLETPIDYNVDYQRDGTGQIIFTTPGITKNKICAINKIEEERDTESPDRTSQIGTSDIFAICNVPSSANIGDIINLDNPILQMNKRDYLSPVILSKMRVRLLDDKGNNLNLNYNDWTMTIICERQYANPV